LGCAALGPTVGWAPYAGAWWLLAEGKPADLSGTFRGKAVRWPCKHRASCEVPQPTVHRDVAAIGGFPTLFPADLADSRHPRRDAGRGRAACRSAPLGRSRDGEADSRDARGHHPGPEHSDAQEETELPTGRFERDLHDTGAQARLVALGMSMGPIGPSRRRLAEEPRPAAGELGWPSPDFGGPEPKAAT